MVDGEATDQDLFASGVVSSMFAMELVVFLEQSYQVTIIGGDLKLDNFRTVARHDRRWYSGSGTPRKAEQRCLSQLASERAIVGKLVGDNAESWDLAGELPVDYAARTRRPGAAVRGGSRDLRRPRHAAAGRMASSPPMLGGCAVRCGAS